MNDTELEISRSPRVFISYSHDNREHCDRVLGLAQQLRRDGIDLELDQFHQYELVHWPRWCEEQLRPANSDFVLCVCTEEYKRRIEGSAPADVGKGVFWEGTLIYSYLYDDKGNSRCVPVYLDSAAAGEIPAILKGYPRFSLVNFALDDAGSDYTKLYRLLTKQPGAEKVGIGEIRKLPPLAENERQTDFMQIVEHIVKSVAEVKGDTREILSILKDRTPPPPSPGRPHNLPPWMTPEIFVGRSKELTTLCDGLVAQGARPVVQPQVVVGEGGIGKTRLAIQVLWLLYLQNECDMAFYVSAASPSELDTELAGLSQKSLLNLYAEVEPPHDLNARREDVIHSLRKQTGRWVMLLDNADSQDGRVAATRLLNELAGGLFIVTSRRRDWPKGTVSTLPLDLFTREEARECLRSRYWKKQPSTQELADFDRVAIELGRLPLALALSASYMELQCIPPARYLAAWKEKHEALLKFSGDDLDKGRSLLATFQLSYDRLDAPAAVLLRLITWLAPEAFPRKLLEDSERVKEILATNQKPSDNYDVSDALAQLRTLSLIRLDEDSFRSHRLVLDCVRASLREELRREYLAITLEWLSDSLPKVDYTEAGWNLWERVSPHLDVVIENGERYHIQNQTLSLLCNHYGLWLYYHARFEMAEPLMRRALAIDEKIFGADHPNVATRLNNLALLLQDTNRLAEAEPLIRRALAINEKSFGADHPEVAPALNNLAQLLQDTNRLAEAEPLMRRALAIDENSLGAHHPNVATRLNNLAQLLQDTNRLAEAEPLIRRALAIDEKGFGAHHPKVATRLNNLGKLLQDTNRLAEAEPLIRRALAIDEKSFGADHPTVAKRLNNLGLLLQATNRLAEAEPLMRRALAINEKSFGADHPEVAKVLNNLGLLLQATNRLAEAEPFMRRALMIVLKFTRTTGHVHSHLRGIFDNYHVLLKKKSFVDTEVRKELLSVAKDAELDDKTCVELIDFIFGARPSSMKGTT